MQGRHVYQPKLFSFVTIESLIPQNHLLRKIDQILSFGFVREMTASYYSSNHGRPSIDPELFFRMMVVGYLYGISSDRQLCEELTYNLAYR
jgi:transposase